MRKAEVRKTAGRCKSKFIYESGAIQGSKLAVCVSRRTKLSICGTWIATGDTVAVASPGPSHRVTDRDIDRARIEHKRPVRSHCHIESRIRSRGPGSNSWPSVLIDDPQQRLRGVRDSRALLARFSSHQQPCANENCHPKH